MDVGMMMIFTSYGWENCSDKQVWDEDIRLARLAADLGSLNAVQAGLERTLSGVLWTGLLRPILKIPALPAFVIVGVVCLWLGRRTGRRGPAEPSFLGMSRPRRRRSRGLS